MVQGSAGQLSGGAVATMAHSRGPDLSAHAQARANRGILYVDEVNLLDDGLVDVVLDSAASGVNTVEREGVGIQHPARFIMIGSGNPQAPVLPVPPFWGSY